MSDHPSLFAGWAVRAILDGRKTQTRRPVVPAPVKENGQWVWRHRGTLAVLRDDRGPWTLLERFCPLGKPGDRLWVRETWQQMDGRGGFALDGTPLDVDVWTGKPQPHLPVAYRADVNASADDGPWRPSIHMPRWACRLTLDLLAVRVERVQDISEDDARAEGCADRNEFACRWIDCYGAASWDQSQWTWVLTFQRASEARP